MYGKIGRAPLASFGVAPKEIVTKVKVLYDSFIQNKAFSITVANVGASRFKGTIKIVRERREIGRSMRARGQKILSSQNLIEGVTSEILGGAWESGSVDPSVVWYTEDYQIPLVNNKLPPLVPSS